MRIWRVIFLLAMLAGLIGCAPVVAADPSVPPDSTVPPHRSTPVTGRWQAYAGTFAITPGSLDGPTVLVRRPGACFTAFGQNTVAGRPVAAAWVASGDDCANVTGLAGFGDPSNTGIDNGEVDFLNVVVAAIPARRDGLLTITRHWFANASGYRTTVSIGPSARDLRPVAAFSPNGRSGRQGPDSVVITDQGYVAAGYIEASPTIWTSPDGKVWRPTTLPGPTRPMTQDAGFGRQVIVAGPAGRLVVVEWEPRVDDDRSSTVRGWHSEDGGATWSTGVMPTLTGHSELTQVLFDGHEYVALGYEVGDSPNDTHSVVLRSTDGATWVRDASVDPDGAWAFARAAVLPDGSLITVSATRRRPAGADDHHVCANAWIESHAGWTNEDLGCRDVPQAMLVLADGRVVAAGGDSMFVRTAIG